MAVSRRKGNGSRVSAAIGEAVAAAEPKDMAASARGAGLRYVTDDRPGFTRRRSGTGYSYRDLDNCPIRDKTTLSRIRALAIPPAWSQVWICPTANGHIQATGRDQRDRKQYRYHARWHEVRDESKYYRLADFAMALPQIRAQVDSDLGRRGLPREKVLALIVALLEESLIRVGNSEYARTNRTFGLTTMLKRHVEIEGSAVRFEFKGKSGKRHSVQLRDRRLARLVGLCQDLPGQDLFQYIDEEGYRGTVGSADVNDYVRDASGADFTAKDYRTWAGTVEAACCLRDEAPPESDRAGQAVIAEAIRRAAERLGNTPAICRKSYVHPQVFESYRAGWLAGFFAGADKPRAGTNGLDPEERAVLALLQAATDTPTTTPKKNSR